MKRDLVGDETEGHAGWGPVEENSVGFGRLQTHRAGEMKKG